MPVRTAFVARWMAATCAALPVAYSVDSRAESQFPDYILPVALERPLAAAHADIEVVDLRPSASPAPPSGGRLGEQRGLLTQPVLGPLLEGRVKPALASNGPAILIRVALVEAGLSPEGARAVVDVSVEAGGVHLATTRGTSTLHGVVRNAMVDTRDELVQAAVVDASDRSVLRQAFVDAVNARIATTRPGAPPTEVAETKNAWTVAGSESRAAAHVLSAVFDVGATYSFGARYLHDHLYGGEGVFWGGYGVEGRLVSEQFKRVDVAAALAVLHGGFGVETAFSVEIGLGPGSNSAVRPIGVAGGYFSFYYLDLGYTYQFVISPTPDLEAVAGSHFGIRINIPVSIHSKSVRCRSPAPCKFDIISGIRDGGS
jgi:hypothetical protein